MLLQSFVWRPDADVGLTQEGRAFERRGLRGMVETGLGTDHGGHTRLGTLEGDQHSHTYVGRSMHCSDCP